MAHAADNLIWIDLEMTGLDPEQHVIIEIGTIVTNAQLDVLAEGPVMAIHQDDRILDSMDDWNTKHHGESGLTGRVRASPFSVADAERATLEFLRKYVPPKASPMCGNSICQDRRFMYRYMPALVEYFHYRNLDVSTLKELAGRWAPQIPAFEKQSAHRVLADICDSIGELKHYREHFLRIPDLRPT